MKANYSSSLRTGLFSIFGLLLLNTLTAQTLRFSVKVPDPYATKDMLARATDNIPNAGRHLLPDGFEIDLPQDASESYVRSIFETVGIPVLSVHSAKGEASLNTEKAGGNNCGIAQLLCSNTSQTANSSGPGTQELTSANQGCLGIEHQSSWYYLNVQTGGTLTMNINPNNSADDYDFAIWGPFTSANASANCPPTTAPVRCSYSALSGSTGLMIPYTGQSSSTGCGFLGLFACTGLITSTNNPADVSEGAGGDAWVSNLTTTAGQIYILLVDNYSNSGNAYAMDFGGTTVLGCTPVVLPVELSSFNVAHTTNGNLLNWTTQSEYRSNYFTVEWTTDPASESWKEIAKVYAAGESNTQLSYSTLHSDPSSAKVNYYRLSQTDIDGEKTVYNNHILSTSPDIQQQQVIHIYNLLGQEVDQSYHGIVIYQYSDGSARKVNQ